MAIISFDFDNTLIIDKKPNPEMIAILQDHHENGDICVIVTYRSKANESLMKNLTARPIISEFVKEHNLPIREIHFTEHQPKGPVLKKIGAILHYDDCEEAIESAKEHGIKTVWIKKKND